MKLKDEQKKLLEAFIFFIAIVVFVVVIRAYFKPFLWIVIIFFLSSPMYILFTKFNISKKISAALALLLLNIFIVLIIYYLGRNIFELVDSMYENNINIVNDFIKELNTVLEKIVGEVNFSEEIMNIFHPNMLKRGAVTTGEGILSYFIGNICAFFILIDKNKFISYFNRLLPDTMYRRIHKGGKNIKSIISIQIFLVFISTVIIIFGFKIFRIDKAFLLGVFCGILDILPYVGTIIVFIPIIIYNIIVKDYLIAFGLICLYILVQFVREILEAKLLSNKFNIHPLVIFLSIYIGMKIFGVIGVFIGPLYSMMVRDIFCDE
ncbi:AI-2E family transporter [Clostridium baratii]|uniref:AI-2E family transporter n=1 Tax=Clostridium baratii TaxID=1561 RepID=UPI0030CAAD60